MFTIKNILVSILSTILLGAVWLLPTLLHLPATSPFSNMMVQVVISLAVITLTSLLFHTRKTKQAVKNKNLIKIFLKRVARALKKYYLKSSSYLKSHFKADIRKKNKVLNRLPWYLVIGDHHSGKTAFLQNTNLNLLPATYLTDLTKDLEYTHQWYLTKEAVLLELPLSEQQIIPESFLVFLNKFSRRFKRKACFNGIVVVLDTYEIILAASLNKESGQLSPLKTFFHSLNETFKVPIPFYYIMAKCDQIDGFHEFFINLNKEEREQIWGITFSKITQSRSLINEFENEFNNLITRLTEDMFHRLENESEVTNKIKITCFPAQVSILKKLLVDFIFNNPFSELQGIVFTSSRQKGSALAPYSSTLCSYYHLPIPPQSSLDIPEKHYFIKKIFSDFILPKKNWVFQTTNWHQRNLILNKATLTLASTLSVFLLLILSFSFTANQANLKKFDQYLPSYEQALHEFSVSSRNLADLEPVFSNFQKFTTLYSPQSRSLMTSFEVYQPLSIHHKLEVLWQDQLNNLLMPRVVTRLEDLLRQPNLDPEIVYQALKGYFVFSPNIKPDNVWLINPIAYDLSVSLKNEEYTQQQILSYLREAIRLPVIPRPLDQQLIAQARARLQDIPPIQFTYYELKQSAEKISQQIKLVDLLGDHFSKVFYLDNPQTNISHFYTMEGYKDLKGDHNQDFIKQSMKTYQILGFNSSVNSNALSIEMTPALWSIYGNDYIKQWQNVINNMHIAHFQNIDESIQVLNSLITTDSPLMKLLDLIKHNTSSLNENNLNIAQQFSALNGFTPDTSFQKDKDSSPFDEFYKNLLNLKNYFLSLSNSPTAEQTEFQDAAAIINDKAPDNPILKLRHQADQLPMPLKQFATEIADNSIKILLQGAKQIINKNWQQAVIPYYRTNIYGRFPFSINTGKMVGLDSFNNFFGNKGVFYQFFQNNLAPFMINNGHSWRLAQIDNLSLNLNGAVLNQINQALLINNMYFQQGDQFSMKFSIQPLFLDPESSSVNLQLASQSLAYRHGPQQSLVWTWPTDNEVQQVVISFSDFQGQNFSKSLEGPWALFSLLNTAGLERGNTSGHYIWNYNEKGHKASFSIVAQNNLPLFDFKSLKEFKLSDSLQ